MKGQRKYLSLRKKTFRVILGVSLLLFIVGNGAALVMHGYSTLRNYKNEARDIVNYTTAIEDDEYISELFRKTKEAYYGMPEDIRDDQDSDEFYETMVKLVDDEFYKARDILVKCREQTGQRNIALVFADEKRGRIVYVVDGDEPEWAYLPGQWIDADLDGIEGIEYSGWRLMISHTKQYGWIGTDYSVLHGDDGNPIGYVVMDMDLNDFLNRLFGFLILIIPLALIFIVALATSASGLLKKNIISHLIEMADAARKYTAKDKVDIGADEPSVFEPLAIHTADELEDLWASMTGMESDVRDTMIRLREITAEQQRLGAELEIATQIQEGTLPRDFPAFPERNEFDIYASMDPAKEVGGDLYDFFMIDDDHLALVIGDVSGKGISAALFMVIAKTLIKSQTMQEVQDPADIFAAVNARLMDVNKARMFVTAWMGILTISTGEIVYVNAGHEYPAIRRAGGLFTAEKDVHSAPLAARKKLKFKSGTLVLEPGDTLFVYTDGVTEANNISGEMMGRERMLDALNREPDADPVSLDRNVIEALDEFVQDAPQFDDTTMLVLKYYGK